jgi:hypothetical protein
MSVEMIWPRQNESLTSAGAYSMLDSEVDLVQFNHEGHINAILEVAFYNLK